MNALTFIAVFPVRGSALPKSAVLGTRLPSRVSALSDRRVRLPSIFCLSSDPSASPEADLVPETSDTPAPAEASIPTEESVQTDPANEAPTTGDDAPEEESGDVDGRSDIQKRRRRRQRKREVTLPLDKMTVGMELEGIVKSVTDYGAFVGDMGTPTDGLLHVSQLASGFVQNVTDVVNVGDKIKVRVMSIDEAKGNFSLTRKTQEEMDSDTQSRGSRRESGKEGASARREGLSKRWDEFEFDPNVFVDAKVMSVTDFGGFCQLVNEAGEALASSPTDGLIHISELSSERVSKVSDVLTEGQIVKVRITSTDRKRNRISMSLRPVGESGQGSDNGSLEAGLASAEKNQPSFKTSFEIAFESAKDTGSKN